MAQVRDYFDEWLRNQQALLSAWMDNAKNMQQAFLSHGGGAAPWSNPYLEYMRTWASASSDIMKTGAEAGVVRDTMQRAGESRNIYERLLEMWTPLWQAIQERAQDVSCYQELLDPTKFKELMDCTFAFSPRAIQEFYNQAQANADTAAETSKKFLEPWMEAFSGNMSVMPSFVQGHPSALLNVFHTNYRAFDNTFGRIFHIPPVGKDREKIELYLKGLDDIAVFMAKNIEYQHVMYMTGLRAIEKLIGNVARTIRSGELKSFDQVFQLWIDINEKEYLELGRREDYSKLQGELMNAGLSVRRRFFKLMELYLYDFPVAVRSEMDDLYKTIYELKKKVKNLESKVKDFTGEEVAA